MYRFLTAVLICTVAHATTPLPQHVPATHAKQLGAQPAAIIMTASAGVSLRGQSGRDEHGPVAVAVGIDRNDSPSQPPTRHMVLAAVALIAGIAIRRYGVSRK